MAKRDKEYESRMQGMLYALNMDYEKYGREDIWSTLQIKRL